MNTLKFFVVLSVLSSVSIAHAVDVTTEGMVASDQNGNVIYGGNIGIGNELSRKPEEFGVQSVTGIQINQDNPQERMRILQELNLVHSFKVYLNRMMYDNTLVTLVQGTADLEGDALFSSEKNTEGKNQLNFLNSNALASPGGAVSGVFAGKVYFGDEVPSTLTFTTKTGPMIGNISEAQKNQLLLGVFGEISISGAMAYMGNNGELKVLLKKGVDYADNAEYLKFKAELTYTYADSSFFVAPFLSGFYDRETRDITYVESPNNGSRSRLGVKAGFNF